jgi:phosphoglycerate dehydrogenase-like enzyme
MRQEEYVTVLFYTHLAAEFPEAVAETAVRYHGHTFITAAGREEYRALLPEADVLVYGEPKLPDLERAKRLSLIIVPYSGVGHLDFAYLQSRGIMAANSPGNGPIVAERAIALALAVTGRVVEFHNDLSRGNWHRTGNPQKPFDYWHSIQGKRAAVLGTGDIGKNIAKLLSGFSCRTVGYRRTADVPPGFSEVTTDLRKALAGADIVFVALPLHEQTRSLIHSGNIDLLAGTFLVNVSRGEIIEEEAFYHALENGTIRGAGLDVWYRYPSREQPETTGSRFPFHRLPNVIVSPHAGSHTPEGKLGQLQGALTALRGYIETGVPANLKFDGNRMCT